MGKGISVEQALQNRKSRVEEERRSSVEQALEDRKKRISSEMSSIGKDLMDRYNTSVSDYKSYAESYAPKYGMDIAEELGRQRDISLSNKQLISDVEAYRSYIGDEKADDMLDNLRKISEGYKYSLDNFDYFQKMDYDLDAGKADLDGLNSAIEEYDGLRKSTPIVSRASSDGDKQLEKIRNNTARQQEILSSYGYDSYSDMKDDYAKKSAYYNQAKLLQGRAKISNDALSAPDFREYADKGEAIDNPSMNDAEGWLVIGGGLWNEDNDGLHIGGKKVGNIVTYSRENADAIQMGGAGMVGDEKYRHMTNDEVDIYNYYLAKEKEGLVEKGSAQKYLDSIEDVLNQRSAGQRASTIEDKPALEFLFGVEAGLDQFRSGISNLFNTDDDYIAPTKTQYTSALVREDLADVGGQFLGSSIGQGAYDLITTTTNMMPSILASTVVGTLNPVAGTAVGAGLMGGSAAGNAYQEMLNAGYDKDQARVYSALTGASEAGLQYALGGIGKLGGKLSGKSINAIASGINNAGLRFAVKFGGEMASEGLEEFMQDVLDPYFKSIATGEIPENVDWEQAFYSGMLGALSAGVLNGVNAGINKNAEVSEAKRIIKSGNKDALVDVGKTFDAETIAYKLADKVTPKTGAWKLSQLLHEVNANLGEQTQADIKNALVQKGMTETDAGSISKWLAKAVDGGNLTRLQQKALDENDVISSVFKEVVLDRNSTVNQRLQGMMNYRGIDGTSGIDFEAIEEGTTKENLSKQATSHMAMQKASEEAVARMLGIGQTRSKNDFSGLDKIASDIARHSNSLGGMKTKSTIDSVKESIASERKVSAEEGTSVKKIQSIKDGKMMLELTDGSVVDSKDVVYNSDDQALLYESVLSMGYSAESANAIVNGYSALSGLSASEYLLGVNEAYNYGKIGYPLSSIKTDGFISDLTDTQKSFAYGLGRADADGSTKSAQNSLHQKKTDAKKKGRVVLSASVSNMTDIQKASISAIGRVVSDVTHNNVVIYESVAKDGRRVFSRDIAGHKAGESAPNGFYDPNTGAIYIDINAGNNGEGAMLWTVAHEMTHFIRQWSPEKFKVLADFLMQEYGKNGVDVQTLIENQIAKAKRAGRNLSFDAAYEEVVADSMSSMFTDTNMSEKLAKLKAQDQTLWEKMKGFFADLYNRIKEAYKGLKPQTQEAMYVKRMMDSVERISDMFAEALVDAGDTFSSADAILVENGISVDSETDSASILSVRDVLDDKKRTKVINSLIQRFGVTKEEAERWISAETSLASLILNPKYSMYLDYESDPDEVAIKKNSDYPQGTVDFSNICAKRREFTSVMNAVLRNFPKHIFAATDLAKIRTIMQQEGMNVPCGICYVEDRRQLDTIVAQDFIDGLKLYREGSKTRPDGKPFNERQLKGLRLTDGDTYIPSVYELVTLEGRNQLKAKNPNMEAAWVKYNNARGMQSVRLLTNEAEYKRQILRYSKKTVKRKNDLGGLRIYSFSDAEMFHLIDIIQVITDSATVGLSLQGYTKVNEYAKAVKDTGEKLNRSLIPKGELGYHMEDGKVVLDYDTVEGIDINSEDFFDNKDNPNIGNITIGVSDVQIRAAMLSDFVDQIIPFHTGQSSDVLGEKGIATWHNYKDDQTDKDISTGKTSKHQVNIYTEVLQVLEEEGKPINKRTFVEKFLDVCKENGLIPRFSQFLNMDDNGNYVYTEGYHKLLVDFKTFAQTDVGEYLPQMPVKPIFDNAYITKLLTDYVQSQKAKDADIAKSMPRVIERITNEIIKPYDDAKYSDRETEQYIAKSTKKYGDVESAAIEHFGTTDDFRVAGYILRDGQMLDFSGAHWLEGASASYIADWRKKNDIRQVDHEDVYEAFEISANDFPSDSRKEFINRGNIRVSPEAPGINIASEPTYEQYQVIRELILDNPYNVPGFYVDIENKDKRIEKLSYSGKVNADRVINDIKYYYATGSVRNQSDLMKFHASDDVKYSTREVVEIPEEKYEELKSHFGTTNNFKVAGYLLKDGTMLDFSGKHWGDTTSDYRQVDHRDVNEVLEESDNYDAMVQMIANGNIRLMPETGGICLSQAPTEKQRAILRNYIKMFSQYYRDSEGVVVDFDEPGGDTVYSRTYRKGTDTRTILRDIDNYFRGGKQSELMQFHTSDEDVLYSDRDSYAEIANDIASLYESFNTYDYWDEMNGNEDIEIADQLRRGDTSIIDRIKEDYEEFDDNEKKIADSIIRRVEGETKYSDRDSEGHKLSKDQQEFFKDSKVLDDNGNLKVVYHGSHKEFSVFDSNVPSVNGRVFGNGFYFSPTKEGAKRWADGIVYKCYLNITKPYYASADMDVPQDILEYIKDLYREKYDEYSKDSSWFGSKMTKEEWVAYNQKMYSNSEIALGVLAYVKNSDGLSNAEYSRLEAELKTEVLKSFGYDGIIYIKGKKGFGLYGGDQYVAFYPEQIKNVTNKKPTSNHDIRYSDRDDSSLDTRTLLSNALATTAKNEIESKYITQYQEKIATINAEQAKLTELRARIKELSFAPGPKDSDQIRKLQEEATKIANRISTFDKQLLKLEATKPLRQVLDREKAKAKKKAEKEGREALDAYRERAARTQRELMDRYQTRIKNNKESRERTELRHKILKKVKELNDLLLNGDANHHVPLALQKYTADALSAINKDTVNAENRIAILREKIARSSDPDKIAMWEKSIDRIELQGENMREKLDALDRAYREIKDSKNPLIANAYDDGIQGMITTIKEEVGDTPLREMTKDQLEMVHDMYKAILHTIRTSNKAFKAARQESISELGSKVANQIILTGGKKKYVVKALESIKKFGWDNMKPIYAMKTLGSETLLELFNNVRAGEDTWAVDVTEAREYFLDKAKKYGYKDWDFDTRYSFVSKSGKEFALNLQEIMSLYAYSKREQADLHLSMGGFVFEDSTVVIKKKGVPVEYKINVADAHNISFEVLQEITRRLTDEQKAFVDEMQSYMSNELSAKGNEVSIALYDIDLFREKNYFPLKSAKQYMFEKNEAAGEVRLKNSGFTKKTVRNANNPIVLRGFMDVWAGHVNDMAMYHAFVLPLEDFNRVWNYKTPTSSNLPTESVKMAIQNAYGDQANKYISQMLTDLNGGARSGTGAGIINKMTSLFKKGAVFASASVVIQQPSAIARAWAYIEPKYFAKTIASAWNPKKHKSNWEEVKKYAPIAIIKEMGYFDTNMGRQTTDWITSIEYEGRKEKLIALFKDGDYRDEVLSKAPAIADEITWSHIWNAVKEEVADTTDIPSGTDEFFETCGKRFTEVIVNTQVYDSVLSRSALMRSKDTGAKMATAFMAEPTTSINMIADALLQAKRGGDSKRARRVIGSVVAQIIINSALVSLVYAARDDDDEKTYAEKYVKSLSGSVIDGLNPLSMIPFGRDIMSIIQGYDVERSDMTVIANLYKSWQNLFKDSYSPYKKFESFVGSVANMFGIPLKNLMRDGRAIWNIVEGIMSDNKTTAEGLKYALIEGVTGDSKYDQIKENLFKSINNNDNAEASKNAKALVDYYVSKGKTEKDAKTSARTIVTKEVKDDFLRAYKAGDNETMASIRRMLKSTGLYEDVVKTTQDWIKNSKK